MGKGEPGKGGVTKAKSRGFPKGSNGQLWSTAWRTAETPGNTGGARGLKARRRDAVGSEIKGTWGATGNSEAAECTHH